MSLQVTKIDHGQPLVVIQIQPRSIVGRREIDREKVNIDLSDLPKNVQAFLRQSFLPEGALRPFGKLFKRARDLLWASALNTEVGYVVDADIAIEILDKFQEIETDVETAKKEFLDRYEELLSEAEDDIRRELSGYAQADDIVEVVRKVAPSKQALESKIGFTYQVFQIEPAQGFDPVHERLVNSGYHSLREGLFGKLIAEVVQDAYVLHKDVKQRLDETGERKIRQKTVGRLRSVVSKVSKLTFIDPRATGLKNLLEDALDQLPDYGPLTKGEYRSFMAILESVADQSALIDHIEQDLPLLTIQQTPAATSQVGEDDQADDEAVVDTQSADATDETSDGEASDVEATEGTETAESIAEDDWSDAQDTTVATAAPAKPTKSEPKYLDLSF